MVWSCGKNREERMVNRYVSKAGESVKERLRKGWRDCVREVLAYRGLRIQECEKCVRDTVNWSDAINGAPCCCHLWS